MFTGLKKLKKHTALVLAFILALSTLAHMAPFTVFAEGYESTQSSPYNLYDIPPDASAQLISPAAIQPLTDTVVYQRSTPINDSDWTENPDGTRSVLLFDGRRTSNGPGGDANRNMQFRNGGSGPLAANQIAQLDFTLLNRIGAHITVHYEQSNPLMQMSAPPWWPVGWQFGTAVESGVRTFSRQQILESTEAWGSNPWIFGSVSDIHIIELTGADGAPTTVTRVYITYGEGHEPDDELAFDIVEGWLTWSEIRGLNANQSEVRHDLRLPAPDMVPQGVGIAWSSSNPAVVSNTGVVTMPASGNVNVVFTATLSRGGASRSLVFNLTVLEPLAEDHVIINNRLPATTAEWVYNGDGTESLIVFLGRRTMPAGNDRLGRVMRPGAGGDPDVYFFWFDYNWLNSPGAMFTIEYSGSTPRIEAMHVREAAGGWWPVAWINGSPAGAGSHTFTSAQIQNGGEAWNMSNPWPIPVEDLNDFEFRRRADGGDEGIIYSVTFTRQWQAPPTGDTLELFDGRAQQDSSTNENFWFILRDLGDRSGYFDNAETIPVQERFGMAKVSPGRADTSFTIEYEGNDGIYFALHYPLTGTTVHTGRIGENGSATITNAAITQLRTELFDAAVNTVDPVTGMHFIHRGLPESHVVFKIGPANAVITHVAINYMPSPVDDGYIEIDNFREGRIDSPTLNAYGGVSFDIFRGRRYLQGSPIANIFVPNPPIYTIRDNVLYSNVIDQYIAWFDRTEWELDNGETVYLGGGAEILLEPGAMFIVEYDHTAGGSPALGVRTWQTGYWPQPDVPYIQLDDGVRAFSGMDIVHTEINGHPWLLDCIHNIGLLQLHGNSVITRITVMTGGDIPLNSSGSTTIIPGGNISMVIGDTIELHPRFDPVHATDVTLEWVLSDPSVSITVGPAGRSARIMAHSVGTATVILTATCNISGVVHTAASGLITVVSGHAVTGISVRPLQLTMPLESDTWVTGTIRPYYASNLVVEWTVEGSAVEIIEERGAAGTGHFGHTVHAHIRAVHPGTATLIVSTNCGEFVGSTAITVTSQSEGIIPFNIFSQWEPGIPGGVPNVYNIHSVLDPADFGNGTSNATPAINAAIQAAGNAASADNPQVVFLLPGTFLIHGTILLNRSYVVLRGSGPADGGTLLRGPHVPLYTTGTTGIVLGGGSTTFHLPNYAGVSVNRLTADARMGDISVQVTDASAFRPGDILMLDRLPDDYGDITGRLGGTEWRWHHYQGGFMMRTATMSGTQYMGPTSPEGHRSVKQYIEIASISGNTLHLSSPLNFDFPISPGGHNLFPEVWNTRAHDYQFIGLENLQIQTEAGGEWWNPGGIIMSPASSYSWIRNIYSNGRDPFTRPSGDTGFRGTHIEMFGFRNEIRDNLIRYSADQRPGGNTYGIRISGTQGLVENNVIDQLNKPILGTVTGGGNVYAYNIIPNAILAEGSTASWTMQAWQETSITTSHGGHSHSDLLEGNFGANMSTGGGDHGNASQMVFFRNHAWGRNWNRSGPGTPQTVGHNLRGINVPVRNGAHASIGNVIFTQENANAFTTRTWGHIGSGNAMLVYQVGGAGDGGTLDRFHWQSDFNYHDNAVLNRNPGSVVPLPDSLFRLGAPDFFDGYVWPPVNPYGASSAQRVGGLPAQSRFEVARSVEITDTNIVTGQGSSVSVAVDSTNIIGGSRVFLVGSPTGVTAGNINAGGTSFNLVVGANAPLGEYWVKVMINGTFSNMFALEITAGTPGSEISLDEENVVIPYATIGLQDDVNRQATVTVTHIAGVEGLLLYFENLNDFIVTPNPLALLVGEDAVFTVEPSQAMLESATPQVFDTVISIRHDGKELANLQVSFEVVEGDEPVCREYLGAALKHVRELNHGDFTRLSWALLHQVYVQAVSLYSNEHATAQQLEDMTVRLWGAIDALVLIAPPPPQADKALLIAAIETAETFVVSEFTRLNWVLLQDALNHARLVVGNENATQDQVNAALNRLNAVKASRIS